MRASSAERVRRGTIQVSVRVNRAHRPDDYRINAEVLASYRRQIDALGRQWQPDRPVPLESLLLLPGVVEEAGAAAGTILEDWPVVQGVLEAAIANMDQMRRAEGRAMAADLKANCTLISTCLESVAQRAPRWSKDTAAGWKNALRPCWPNTSSRSIRPT